MAMNSEQNNGVRVLKTLAMRITDSADGYDEAAKVAKSGEIETEFRAMARERRELARELEARIVELGGDPKDGGSIEGGAHRFFLNLRSVFEDDTKVAIKEVERGEDNLLEAFQDALKKTTGPNGERTAAYIRDIERRVRMDRDRWSSLKHMIETTSMHGGSDGRRGSSDAGAAGPV